MIVFENEHSTAAIAGKIKTVVDIIVGAVLFSIENNRKRYPYILLGEKKWMEYKKRC